MSGQASTDAKIASFAYAKKDVSGNRRPQAIAHRGYKAKFPENTMGAFRGAVDVGADALETDIHLSKDGVVLLSHVSVVDSSAVIDILRLARTRT
jgi:glycerophosphoryl diester phosphodiesterase